MATKKPFTFYLDNHIIHKHPALCSIKPLGTGNSGLKTATFEAKSGLYGMQGYLDFGYTKCQICFDSKEVR